MLPKDFSFVLVDYCKPGADLARNVYNKIQSYDVDVCSFFVKSWLGNSWRKRR